MGKSDYPGTQSANILAMADKYYATTTMGARIVVRSANGAIITDEYGYQYIDLHCDAGVNNLGHSHPKIVKAIQEQAALDIFSECHNAPNRLAMVLASILSLKSPVKQPAKVFFGNSGAEGNEAARSICQAYRFSRCEDKRKKAIYFKNAFAGRTKGVKAGSTSKPEVQRDPFIDHCDKANSIYLPYPRQYEDWSFLKSQLDDIDLSRVDRLLIEIPCQGEGGIIPVDEEALKYIYSTARDAGVIFIADCVQTGMGRVGTLFGCDVFPWLKPDILVLGKALGGGLPNGEIIFRADLDWQKKGMHSNTFGGAPLFASSALAFISEMERVLADGACKKIEKTLEEGLKPFLKYGAVTDVRGTGAMWGVEFKTPKMRDAVVEKGERLVLTEEYGLRLLSAGRKTVRIMPPLVITNEQLDLALSLLEKVIRTLA